MTIHIRQWLVIRPLLFGLAWVLWVGPSAASFADEAQPDLDVPYEPTHPDVVQRMLTLVNVQKDDVLYDLGCGDGRIVVAAAKKFGARGLGVDIDPQRLKESQENADIAQVADRVRFRKANIMDVDLSEATVVTLYLLNEINLQLRPKLFAELKPGTRIVSHCFHMDDWKSDTTIKHPKARNQTIHHWIMPASVGGYWSWKGAGRKGDKRYTLKLSQEFQKVTGLLGAREIKTTRLTDVTLRGSVLEFTASIPIDGKSIDVDFKGIVEGETIRGTQEWHWGSQPGKRRWIATRRPISPTGDWKLTVKSSKPKLNGRWQVQAADFKAPVRYSLDDSKETIASTATYSWGASIRCEWRVEKKRLVFTGFLNRGTATGKIACEDWEKRRSWSARKMTNTKKG